MSDVAIMAGSQQIVVDEVFPHTPEALTYAVRGRARDHLDPGLPKFEKMPPG